jgi:hypothetical protein
MNPHPKSISRIMATARAPPPCRSFVGSFQASEKTPNFTALSNWLPHPAQPPFTLDRFLNPPWGATQLFVVEFATEDG